MFSTPEETFEWYANELRKISELSARYFLDDPYCKQGYRSEINEVIRLIRADFNIALYNNKARYQRIDGARDWVKENIGSTGNWPELYKYTEEIKLEYESEKLAYAELRKINKDIYNETKSFSGEGWAFYSEKTGDILGGVLQTIGGAITYRVGSRMNNLPMKGAGVLGVVLGLGKAQQGVSDIVYELTDSEINMGNNFTLSGVEKGVNLFGGDKVTAQKIYYELDFATSLYLGFAAYKVVDPIKRTTIRRLPTETSQGLKRVTFFEKYFPDNVGFRIVRWTNENFKRKLTASNKLLLLASASSSIYKLKLVLEQYEKKQ
ncbi:hypothetical protein AB7179_15010 [Providencia manganoxydans]|uniref:hypothetical protein n=1 Tax=Providencia manganoxydans TaxID=2923283 RepID=UPI0034E61653